MKKLLSAVALAALTRLHEGARRSWRLREVGLTPACVPAGYNYTTVPVTPAPVVYPSYGYGYGYGHYYRHRYGYGGGYGRGYGGRGGRGR
jgi:hypothetical protein